MTNLKLAAERFQKAVDSLERATLPLADSRRSLMEAEERVAVLLEERDRLLARIAELEEETRSLSGLAEEAERSVEGAIAEVRNALAR